MKKILVISSLILIPGLVWAAESKPAATPQTPSFNDVANKVSKAFCGKMEQCSKQKIPMNDCVGQMNDAFIQNYKALPVDKKVSVSADQLDQCVKSVQNSTCDTLKKASTLPGCDFISQISG